MGNIGYVSAFFRIMRYTLSSYRTKQKITERRLRALVKHARQHSPYFAELYKDIGDNFSLTDLPPVSKADMHENYKRWHTISGLDMDELMAFVGDPENVGKLYRDKYSVLMTSGSTGKPAVVFKDASSQNIEGVMAAIRCIRFNFPMVNVCDAGGYGIDNESVRHNKGKAGIIDKLVSIVESKQEREELCEELAAKRPRIIMGYTGVISLLANDAMNGLLKIKPKIITTSGEHMSESTREMIMHAFPGAEVHSIYGCTEGGAMAYECRHNHLHINSDWVILEPMDENNNVVPYGEECDHLLLTNLSNMVTPLIRYELTDRAIVHDGGCPCGRKGLWIEVEGRTNSLLHFDSPNGEVQVPTMAMWEAMENVNECGIKHFSTYQLIVRDNNELELRLNIFDGEDPEECLRLSENAIRRCLLSHGVTECHVTLSPLKPQLNAHGKLKAVYQENAALL